MVVGSSFPIPFGTSSQTPFSAGTIHRIDLIFNIWRVTFCEIGAQNLSESDVVCETSRSSPTIGEGLIKNGFMNNLTIVENKKNFSIVDGVLFSSSSGTGLKEISLLYPVAALDWQGLRQDDLGSFSNERKDMLSPFWIRMRSWSI